MELIEANVTDATHLELTRPLPAGGRGRVYVLVADPQDGDADHPLWTRASLASLERAYGEDEPEYTLDMVRERNPEYRA